MNSSRIYRISFVNESKVYEVFARQVYEADLYGFIAIEELVFGSQSDVVIDPSEERLKAEFASVNRTFVPLHAIVRIDEVEKPGVSKIHALDSGKQGNISPFARPLSKKND